MVGCGWFHTNIYIYIYIYICMYVYIYIYICAYPYLSFFVTSIVGFGWLVGWLVPSWLPGFGPLQEEFDWFCDLLSDAAEGPAAGKRARPRRAQGRGPRGDLIVTSRIGDVFRLIHK